MWASLAVAFGSAAAASTPEPTSEDGWIVDRFEWSSTAEVRQLVVENAYGDVRVRTAKSDTVELLGLLQHEQDDSDRPSVDVAEEAGRVRVQVVMPDAERAADRRRADISLLLPAGVPLVVVTTDGLIRAKNVQSDIDATSTRGRIDVSTSGTVRIENKYGDVAAMLIGHRWANAPAIETQTGTIEVWVDAASNVRIDAATSGVLSTDFSVDVDYDARLLRKHAVATLGNGEQRVRLESAKGDIRILRSPLQVSDPGQ